MDQKTLVCVSIAVVIVVVILLLLAYNTKEDYQKGGKCPPPTIIKEPGKNCGEVNCSKIVQYGRPTASYLPYINSENALTQSLLTKLIVNGKINRTIFKSVYQIDNYYDDKVYTQFPLGFQRDGSLFSRLGLFRGARPITNRIEGNSYYQWYDLPEGDLMVKIEMNKQIGFVLTIEHNGNPKLRLLIL